MMKKLIISKSITPREYKSLSIYFNEIDKIGMINAQQEVMLARRIQSGDMQAVELLTKANLRFVISVAKQYQNRGLTLGDLINEGNLGLITAAKRYDESKGFKFISFAVWWIRQAIISAIAVQARTIRLPYSRLNLLNKVHRSSTQLEQEHGRKPSVNELADCLGLSTGRVTDLISRESQCVSIHEPLKPDDEFTSLDFLRSDMPDADYKMMYDSIKREIQHALKVLDERGREILTLFFGLGQLPRHSMEEIAEKFNITKEHASRLKSSALNQLRASSHAPVLMSCLY